MKKNCRKDRKITIEIFLKMGKQKKGIMLTIETEACQMKKEKEKKNI